MRYDHVISMDYSLILEYTSLPISTREIFEPALVIYLSIFRTCIVLPLFKNMNFHSFTLFACIVNSQCDQLPIHLIAGGSHQFESCPSLNVFFKLSFRRCDDLSRVKSFSRT